MNKKLPNPSLYTVVKAPNISPSYFPRIMVAFLFFVLVLAYTWFAVMAVLQQLSVNITVTKVLRNVPAIKIAILCWCLIIHKYYNVRLRRSQYTCTSLCSTCLNTNKLPYIRPCLDIGCLWNMLIVLQERTHILPCPCCRVTRMQEMLPRYYGSKIL